MVVDAKVGRSRAWARRLPAGLPLPEAMLSRLSLPFILMLTVVAAAAQAPNLIDAQGRKQGPWSKAWPNGQIRYTGQFKDDRAVGEFRHFSNQGKLESLQVYAPDGRSSRAVHYYPSGQVLAKGNYVGQDKDSTWTYFSTDGSIRKTEEYSVGELNGSVVSYYGNGMEAELDTWRKGVQHGPSKSWFDSGKLKSEANYVDGHPEGRMVFYFPSGAKEIEGMLVNGDRDGEWVYFNDDGSIQLRVLYAKGAVVKERKENGLFTEYYDDEQVKSEVRYKRGRREGKFTEWHDNGRWVMKPVKSDPMTGAPADMERLLEGQTKAREGTYVNDLLEGEVKEFDEQGKLVRTTRFVEGVEQP